jgi:hypothetical protein
MMFLLLAIALLSTLSNADETWGSDAGTDWDSFFADVPELYDCTTRESWSDDKKAWCCKNKQLGCPDFIVPVVGGPVVPLAPGALLPGGSILLPAGIPLPNGLPVLPLNEGDECYRNKGGKCDDGLECLFLKRMLGAAGTCEPVKRSKGQTCGYVFGIGQVGNCADGLKCKCVGKCADVLVADAPSTCVDPKKKERKKAPQKEKSPRVHL